MDRRFYEIQKQMLAAKDAVSELSALEVLTESEQTINSVNATSKVSIWRLFIWIFSFALWNHEKIVSQNAANSRPQNLQNLQKTILDYHDGLDLVWIDGAFSYDLTGVVNPDSRKIIARCSILESNDGELVIKVAVDNAGVLQPATPEQELRILEYIRQIKVPGVTIRLVNKGADKLKISLSIYVDSQIMDLDDGTLLNVPGSIKPAKVAIESYLSKLKFNGAFVKDDFRTELRNSEGVTFAVIDELKWKFDLFPFTDIGEWKVAEAGYFKIDDVDLTINYLSDVLVNG